MKDLSTRITTGQIRVMENCQRGHGKSWNSWNEPAQFILCKVQGEGGGGGVANDRALKGFDYTFISLLQF